MANSFSISSAVGTGWEYAKKHGLIIAVILLIFSFISDGLVSLLGPSVGPDEAQRLGQRIAQGDMAALQQFSDLYTSGASNVAVVVVAILGVLLGTGIYNAALGIVGGRQDSVTFSAFKLPLTVYVKFFVVSLIVSVLNNLALLCCVVPFFFVAPRLAFAGLYIIDNPEAGILEAIRASWGMTKGSLLSLIGLGFTFVGLCIVGFLCCCVGAYFAYAVMFFAIVAVYYQLRGNWA